MIQRRKYGNKRALVDGIWFDSIRESVRYQELKLLVRAGKIDDLTIHPPFPLYVNNTKIAVYKADFAYVEDGKLVVEDVKSKPTRTSVYRLKVKHLKAQQPDIDHREIF